MSLDFYSYAFPLANTMFLSGLVIVQPQFRYPNHDLNILHNEMLSKNDPHLVVYLF